MGTIVGLYGACSEIEVALDCLFRKQGYRPAYADDALAKIRAGIGDGIFSIRSEPRQTAPWSVVRDDQGYALAIACGERYMLHLNPGTERNEEEAKGIVARLNAGEPRQTAGEMEAVNATLAYLNAELDKRDRENEKMLALIRNLVTVFASEPGIDLLWDEARALLARKGERDER